MSLINCPRLIAVGALVLIGAITACSTVGKSARAEQPVEAAEIGQADQQEDDLSLPQPEPAAADLRVFEGRGQMAIDALDLPAAESVLTATHNGARNFIIWAHSGQRRDLLINKSGQYSGTRLVSSNQPVSFDIQADGLWQIKLQALSSGGQPPFSGSGDDVSQRFAPPNNGAWEINHDGKRNFIVRLHCSGRTQLIQNQTGEVSGSRVVTFGRGPCFWEVQADGVWALSPR